MMLMGIQGLASQEALRRLSQYGPNAIARQPGRPLIWRMWNQFTHLMAVLLWGAGLLAFVAGMPQLGWAIWSVNLINGAFSFWQEFKAERAVEALRRLLPQVVRVRRDGQEMEVAAESIVPGDIVLLSEGDRIAADGTLVKASHLKVDHSTLTGESHPTQCDMHDSIFAGTIVVCGTGEAEVTCTGMATEFGRIAHLTQTVDDSPSPLQVEMVHVTRCVTWVAISVGLVFLAIAMSLTQLSWMSGTLLALSLVVAFVPEGLLPTVTLALAVAVQRMARRKALVKRLSAVETLGCTSVICTDKTGTLTQNEMTVREIWVDGRGIAISGVGYNRQGRFHPALDEASLQLLTAAALCNNARLLDDGRILGDPTEAALLVAAAKTGLYPDRSGRISEIPFESERKRMTVLHAGVAYVKGAPMELLRLCQLSPEAYRMAADAVDSYARQGLRVLALACRQVEPSIPLDEVETELTFLGLAAMMDPPRADVESAVRACHEAGIRIVMITGDYGLTAENVARRIGIIRSPHAAVVNGSDLASLSDAQLRDILQGEVVFARAVPEHKLRIVQVLQSVGHIVAVTGDGVNDAPALKKADIGVAMGRSGTDVAPEAADMVLTDDNFASIIYAIEEGRGVYENIRKFLGYILTSNSAEAMPVLFFAFSGGRIPLGLNVMQILSIDLGTDMLPALALGLEPPYADVMRRPPRRPQEHLVTPSLLLRSLVLMGVIQGLGAMAAFFLYYHLLNHELVVSGPIYEGATGMALCAIVMSQIGNVFAWRGSASVWSNPAIYVGIAFEIAFMLSIIYLPVLQGVFGTRPLEAIHWLWLLLAVPILPLVEALRKRWAGEP